MDDDDDFAALVAGMSEEAFNDPEASSASSSFTTQQQTSTSTPIRVPTSKVSQPARSSSAGPKRQHSGSRDEEEDALSELLAAMSDEVNGMQTQHPRLESRATESTTTTRVRLSKKARQPPTAAHSPVSAPEESPSVLGMMERIKQLEQELARQKGINTAVPQVDATSQSSVSKKPTLTDIGYNVFANRKNSATKSITAPTGKSNQKLSLRDIGLSESDSDEDFPSGLNAAGRDLKRKLAAREEEDILAAKRARVEVTPPARTGGFSSFSAPFSVAELEAKSKKSSAAKSKNNVVEMCELSGIRILNPVMTAEILKNSIGDAKMFRLSQLNILKSQITNRTDWLTIGVVVQKLPTKQAANGASFSIWKISDLEDTVHLTTLFLFADAHTEDWKIPVRTVVAILNATIMPRKEGKGQEELAISVNQPGKLIEMGFAEDMGICKGRTKNGLPCVNLTNTLKAEYCVYHLHGALQKVSSQRMDLQSNFSGVQPKTSKVKEAAHGYMYGGKMFSALAPSAATGSTKKHSAAAPKTVVVSREAQALIDDARTVVKAKMSEDEQNTLDTLTAKNSQLNQLVVTDGPGARNLVRSVTKKEADSKPAKFITPTQLLNDHRTAMAKLLADQNRRANSSGASGSRLFSTSVGSQPGKRASDSPFTPKALSFSSKLPAVPSSVIPKLARGSQSGGTISLDSDEDDDLPPLQATPNRGSLSASPRPVNKGNMLTPSQNRALAKLQESGKSIKKTDPNKMSTGLSARARDRIEKLTTKNLSPEPVQSKKQICNLQDDPELKALLAEMSQHDDLCKLNDIDYMDSYFQRSAAKEGLEEALESTTEMECKVVTCMMCKYTASSLSERCFKERHAHTKHKATKKFFQCRKCSKRKPSFNAIMPSPCKSCGMQNFQRCGMLAYAQKGPKLDSEVLLIRGEEGPRFLNDED